MHNKTRKDAQFTIISLYKNKDQKKECDEPKRFESKKENQLQDEI